MPVGYEEERIYKSAIEYKADKVVLIGHSEDGPEDEERAERIIEQLANHSIQVVRDSCDIFDLYDSLGLIAEFITEFEDDEVYVNVSTGSKVTAIAGMIACMAIDATPYYVRARDYDGNHPSDIESVEELPQYPIDAPEQQQIQMLYVIDQMIWHGLKSSKGKLIHVGEHLNMPFVTEMDIDDKGKYRVLDNEILDPMEERGYITIEQDGRNKIVITTEEGEKALRAFRYLIDDSQKQVVQDLLESDRL
ncbi:HFX_2341 family transcriptional regulator domain-containing protein [Halomicrococcus gelatinilyticus]|uniref:HFX_2341 family transcriptional regulator domain-containing protein n=1 Tax=Halomicrococcus gelatinilyticus TaxID=1702103 RepID=UPI002E0DE282